MARNRKNDIKFHEELKRASIAVYGKKGASMPEGYVRKDEPVENKSNGFYGEVWQKGNDIVIVYRGTDSDGNQLSEFAKDLRNDIAMARKNIPAQATDALALYDKIKRENKHCDISVTGHSLGGSLAQIVGSIRGTFAATFNAYGTKDMYKDPQNLKPDNIVNYVNEFDYIGMANAENNVGDTYSVSNNLKDWRANHQLEDMPSLENRMPKTSEELKQKKEEMIASAKRIGKESIQKVGEKLGGTIHDTASKIKQCVGSYQVSGYTREDGTEIKGYVRKCGARHGL